MSRIPLIILDLLIVLAILIGLFFQLVAIPGAARDQVIAFPPYAAVQAPLVTAAIAFIACFQVSLVGVWGLLHRAARGTFFEQRTPTWSNVVIGAAIAATVVAAALFAYVTVTDIPSPTDGMEGIGLWLGSAVLTVAAVAVVLVLFVGRGLLRKAVANRTELDAVV